MFKTFEILNFGHAQRRRLRRVLGFICNLVLEIWNLNNFILENKVRLYCFGYCYISGTTLLTA